MWFNSTKRHDVIFHPNSTSNIPFDNGSPFKALVIKTDKSVLDDITLINKYFYTITITLPIKSIV